MKRIYEPAAYAPRTGCWWDETVSDRPDVVLRGDLSVDVAIIGAGFAGTMAARQAAANGLSVALLDAASPAFGASGRNGGFCCLGGAKASGTQIARLVGTEGLSEWRATERAAIETVARFLDETGTDADRHSDGETCLAHTPTAWRELQTEADTVERDYGVAPRLTDARDLPGEGLSGPFHGALTIPLGFGLNPRKYHTALLADAQARGVQVYSNTPVRGLSPVTGGWRLRTPHGSVRASRVVLATNGYASEDVPPWMRARYLPVQSSVLVTEPLTDDDQRAAGWTSDQMAYDTRMLLHYFRKLPDGRFLFGMRGGLRATPRAERAIFAELTAHFHRMFPAWSRVGITHRWQGLVCLTRALHPFCGPVPEMPGVFATFGYHGNGVAMASHCGAVLGALVSDQVPDHWPELIKRPPERYPLGTFRRHLLRPAYALAKWRDG